jgi:hypothetical protein
MQMFVAVSRAREWVQLLETRQNHVAAAFHAELPSPDILQRETWKKEMPTTRTGRPTPAVAAAEKKPMVEEWETWARSFAKNKACPNEDRRPKGCFWLFAPVEYSAELERHGFRYSVRRQGWWRV